MGKKRTTIIRTFAIIMITIGAVLLALSSWLVSSFLAILGLTLFFWAIIIYYITPEKYVPLKLLKASYLPNVINIEKILLDENLTAKGFYLPPKNLRSADASVVYIPQNPQQSFPNLKQIIDERTSLKNPDGFFLTPLGWSLLKLFEEELGKSFAQLSIVNLPETLPRLLVEKLELVEKVEIQTQDDNVTITVEGSILQDICQETKNYSLVHESMGCLLSSSIACMLAKVTGKTVKILNEEEQKGNVNQIRYQLLED